MKKKIVIIIAAVVLVLALLVTGVVLFLKGSFSKNNKDNNSSIESGSVSEPVSLEPSGEVNFSIGSVEGKVGDTVSVPVEITNNPGFVASLLKFKYDTKSLKYKGYDKGDFLSSYEISDNKGTIYFLAEENADVKDNGVVINLKFEVLKDAKTSDIELISDDETMLVNWDEQFYTVSGTNGKVTIK